MIYVFCQVHGMNGKPVGGKIYAIPKLNGMTLKLRKKVYANIVDIDGKLKKLGRA